MTTTNEKLRNVAEIAARIMMSEKALHPNQQKLDVHEPEKDELTAKDFEMLRKGKKADVKKEEVELEEAEKVATPTGMRVYGPSYGNSQQARADQTKKDIDKLKGPKMKELKSIEAEKKKKMSEMIELYKTQGMKAFFESLKKEEEIIDDEIMLVIDAGEYAEVTIGEEASQDEFNAEIEKAKAKSQGKEKAMVAKGAVQAVKNEEVDLDEAVTVRKTYNDKHEAEHEVYHNNKRIGYVVHDKKSRTHTAYHSPLSHDSKGHADDYGQIDDFHDHADAVNTIKRSANVHMSEEVEQVEERSMTEPEMKKKEEIVKSMKKGIAGFKERYGDRAKEVMYATATKQAMKEENQAPSGYQYRDGKLIPKIHPKMTPHEHGYDYTMQTIEDAGSKSEIHRHHREILDDNPHPKGSQNHKNWEAGTRKAKADHLKNFS